MRMKDRPWPAKGRIDYDRSLNPAQNAAVGFAQGPLIVIAGAGTGKTRTLTYRVAKLVEDGIPPEAILLLSFTRKASREMLKQASDLLDYRCRRVSGGTFHSFANIILRRYARHIGFYSGFSILDRADSEDLINMVRKEKASGNDTPLPRKATLANIFSRAINKSVSIEEIIYEDYPHFESSLEPILELWEAYCQRKQEHHFCDYDDLLVYLHRLLSDNKAVRDHLITTYRYILVDEYQDTNLIQADIIRLLAGSPQNIMVVGDDSQSIYAFRGANFENIIRFSDAFPAAKVIKLEENYRSRQPILDLANAIIESAAEKYSKSLFTRRSGGRKPILTACSSENSQSRYVVGNIFSLASRGVSMADIAVLFRSGFHSFDLELELNRCGINYVKFGGFKFTASAHIKDLLAHLRIVFTPNDRLSWYRVLMMIDTVGPKTAQTIFEAIRHKGKGARGLTEISLNTKNDAAITPLKTLVKEISGPSLSVEQMGERIVQYYLPIVEKRYDDHPRRLRDLRQLITIMARYQNPESFLSDMALEPPDNSIDGQLADAAQAPHRLTLSTIHSAKGLEWHTVFVIWALDGRFPSHHAIDKPEALEEERRLLYVAATRAKENLYITYPSGIYDRTTQSVLYHPSRFLDDIPEECLDRVFCAQ